MAALVLCGGGSRGAVEVGLYRALVELGIGIDFIVSSSIGAVNGALIAAGLSPAEVAEHWRAIGTRDVVGSRWQLVRLLWGAPSVFWPTHMWQTASSCANRTPRRGQSQNPSFDQTSQNV